MAEYISLVRVLQLSLGSVIGLLCIYFGYRLFSQIPVNITNDGQIKMPNLGEVKLKVAPGIFFAVLGTTIVYFSMARSIQITSAKDNAASQEHQASIPQEDKGFSYSQNGQNIPASTLQLPDHGTDFTFSKMP